MARTVDAEVRSLVISANIPQPYVVSGNVAQSCAGGVELTWPCAGGTKVLPLVVGVKGLVLPNLAQAARRYHLARFVWFAPRYCGLARAASRNCGLAYPDIKI